MVEVGHGVAAPEERASARPRILRALAIGTAAAAAVLFLVRLPAALTDFQDRAKANDAQTSIGRTIQASDGLGIDNEFVIQALALLPPKATYVLAQPATDELGAAYGISPTTLLALRGYVRFLLLPRREAPPARAEYVLCYACDTDPFDKRGLERLWTDPHGFVIGRLG